MLTNRKLQTVGAVIFCKSSFANQSNGSNTHRVVFVLFRLSLADCCRSKSRGGTNSRFQEQSAKMRRGFSVKNWGYATRNWWHTRREWKITRLGARLVQNCDSRFDWPSEPKSVRLTAGKSGETIPQTQTRATTSSLLPRSAAAQLSRSRRFRPTNRGAPTSTNSFSLSFFFSFST